LFGGPAGRPAIFFYVDDAARGIILAAQKYEKPQPVNLGSRREIKIKDLVSLIAELTGFKGRIVWDRPSPTASPGEN